MRLADPDVMSVRPLALDWSGTALVLLDLMPRLLTPDLAPRPGAMILQTCQQLAAQARARGATVVHVRSERPDDVQPPGSELAPGLLVGGDLVVVKHSFGAFDDEQLHAHLCERHISTLVLAGVMTDLAVVATARDAAELEYDVVLVEDAMSAFTAPGHDTAILETLPPLGTIVKTGDLLG